MEFSAAYRCVRAALGAALTAAAFGAAAQDQIVDRKSVV